MVYLAHLWTDFQSCYYLGGDKNNAIWRHHSLSLEAIWGRPYPFKALENHSKTLFSDPPVIFGLKSVTSFTKFCWPWPHLYLFLSLNILLSQYILIYLNLLRESLSAVGEIWKYAIFLLVTTATAPHSIFMRIDELLPHVGVNSVNI